MEEGASPDAEAQNGNEPAEMVQPAADPAAPSAPGQYWLRVHGYVSDLSREVAYYHDFFDLQRGRLPGDPRQHLRAGDVIIFYADGPGALYGVATVAGEVEGPLPDVRQGQIWEVPIKRELLVKEVSKGPHVMSLEPPSGRHFVRYVRDYTYIRLPEEDGPYLIEQVKTRAGRAE
jgi:hypothetical protein